MSVFSVWVLCRRGMSVFVLNMVQEECFFFGLEEYLYVLGLDIVQEVNVFDVV
jgi:hypothetical protein